MSRTIRKRVRKFNPDWYIYSKKDVIREYHKYHSRSDKWVSKKLPKKFRNSTNRRRRMVDKSEIIKYKKLDNYDVLCSNWNCKDSNHWGYW